MADTDTATAPPSTPIQPESGPDLTAMIPLQGTPESVDVNTPNSQPIATQPGPDLTATIPSETAPNNPDIERQFHEAWWRKTLDKVGTILGGDTTIHITKDKDGNVTMSHDPSTTGEKWGRVAAAALSGAGAGLANSQGPGGLARATAAGIQTGVQLPQQREQEAQQTVDFDNKQMLAKANRIHLTQQTYALAAEAKMNDLKFNEESANNLNAYYQALASSPNAKDLGTIDPSDPNSTSKAAAQNPGAMDAFLHKGNQKLVTIPGPDHKLHLVLTDKTWEEQRNTEPTQGFVAGADKDGNPTLTSKMLPPNTDTNGNIYNFNSKVLTSHYANMKAKADADKAEHDANKPTDPKTYQDAYSAASSATTPSEKQRLTNLGDELYKKAQGLRTINQISVGTPTPAGSTPADMIKPGAAFGPETVNGINAQKLASADLTLDDLPKRMAKGAATPQQMIAAAEEYSQQSYGLPYSPTQIGQEKKLFDNIKTQGVLDGMDKMIGVGGQPGYLDTVVRLGQQAVGANSPAPWNDISLAVRKKFGEQAAKNFNTALGEVQRSLPQLIGNPLLGGSDSDLKQRKAEDMFGTDVTAGNLLSTANTLNGMLQGSKDSLTRNNRFLQRRYGLKGPYAAQYGAPANPQLPQNQQNPQQPDTSQAAKAIPTGKIPAYLNGQVVGYADDKKGTNYHAF
jgi:hypothetical protein